MQEKQGNVLVFMSTVAGVNELVQAMRKALAHDPGCIVLGLYADMNDDEKARVTSFHDLSKFPQNRQKRLICVATDMAESGVTIPGGTCNTNDILPCWASLAHMAEGAPWSSNGHSSLLGCM